MHFIVIASKDKRRIIASFLNSPISADIALTPDQVDALITDLQHAKAEVLAAKAEQAGSPA